jgi:outer membrane lipoprotein-sorting protein
MRSKERRGACVGRLTRRAWLAGRLAILAVCAALVATSTAQPPRPAAPGDPKAIIDHVDRLLRGESSAGEMTMTVVTERWKRSLTLRVWSQGTDRALIRVIAPAKEAGTATLKAGGDIWNYLPKIDRVIRVPTSMMMGSWMGSHFTNDDLVKESRLVRDYDVAVSFDGERGSTRVWEFTLTPRPEAAVVWGKVVIEVRQADLMPTWGRYHGEDGELRRTLTFGSYRVLGGRLVPTTMTVVPADKPTESTVVQYTRLRFDVAIPPETFSLAALRQPA